MKHYFRGKALSVRQPWASAIVFAGKDVENRSQRTHYRGPVAIHASLAANDDLLDQYVRLAVGSERRTLRDWIQRGRALYGLAKQEDLDAEVPTGHIIGIAMLVDCCESFASPWWDGPDSWAWVLRGVVPIEPIPVKGALGLWNCKKFAYRPLVRTKRWGRRALPAER